MSEWHHTGKPNLLGTYTIFFGHGEGPHNQVCAVNTLEDANLICAVHDLLVRLRATNEFLAAVSRELFTVSGYSELMQDNSAAIEKAEGRS